MLYVVLVLFTLAVVALCAWTTRREPPAARALPCSSDRPGTIRGF